MDAKRFLFLSADAALVTDLAHGNDPEVEVHSGFQVCIRVVLPPFPFDDEQTTTRTPGTPR